MQADSRAGRHDTGDEGSAKRLNEGVAAEA
jgi:hypothetical protein